MTGDDRQRRLIEDLGRLADHGVRGPEDIINAAPRLLALVAAQGGEWARARGVVRLLHAATQALGHPRGSALRALLALDPAPRGMGVRLTKTERRHAASVYYRIEGDTFRKTHEKNLITALAIEIDHRLTTGHDTTRGDHAGDGHGRMPSTRPGPKNPPPPASTFRPLAKREAKGGP
ncbi:hypothetical protein ThrDRAFT_04184 [Frankia casuarinae]|uniref:Uncharacterized protein n=1 Tax=Frankia casuarinae (strain DSM 45818 / CECT 9043 / HFP020203 / CcI3) TaxID=106370 RepID=Q2JGR3_FRACC|nr:hypothetical protein Francci3_0135 [Frankia casuarinae]ESZ99831.1 hypothetical protein CcI6DRAFT_04753 [Frankia sp. CcI6]EYT90194.1 hypothetical protein ThrDRAFT_04184 [Frankia casuarinae]KFB04634.1 hypothetical protein ALLO2DRAFT_02563 [Frankia sp. Allo2]